MTMPGTFRSALLPDERLVWEGRPEIGPYSMRGAWFLIPFSIVWGGFAIFWEASVIVAGVWPFALFGIPFVLVGLYMLVGRIWVARREASRTMYAITDSRVLIETGAFSPSRTELDLRDLPGFQVDHARDGTGTITFGAAVAGFGRVPPGWPTMGMYAQPPAFQAIRDVDRVAGLLREAREQARTAPGGAWR